MIKKFKSYKVFVSIWIVMILFANTGRVSYADIETSISEAENYGELLNAIELINGYQGDLMPDKSITRTEMMAIISKFYTFEFDAFQAPTEPSFKDVPVNHWGYKYVEFAYSKGITTGSGNQTFGVNNPVTYNQVSIFLYRIMGFTLGTIQYPSAAFEIGEQHGLKLLIEVDGNAPLLRRQVFELLTKTLTMDDALGIPMTTMLLFDSERQTHFTEHAFRIIETPVVMNSGGGFYTIYYANGDIYTGEYDGNLPVGNGILTLKDGNRYIGQFEAGEFSGYGIFLWTNNDHFEGYWKNSMYNGLGFYTYEGGAYQYGEWVDDSLVTVISEVSPETIINESLEKKDIAYIFLTDINDMPINGVAVTITDELNSVVYNRITDENGKISLPKNGDTALFSLMLGENSIYRFDLSKDLYAVTIFGPYETEVLFKLVK